MLRIYLSHSIRGIRGNDTTPEEIAHNCRKACDFARLLRAAVPDVEVYCPAEMDEFPDIAFRKGLFSIDDLLEVDCGIISRRDVVLAFCSDSYISSGMAVEIKYAQLHNIPVHIVLSLDHAVDLVKRLLVEKGR